MLFALHESATTYSRFDLGSFSTNFMLVAEEKGYSTIVAASIVFFADRIREIIDIPDDIKLVAGIGISYADENHPLNQPESPRNSPKEFTRFLIIFFLIGGYSFPSKLFLRLYRIFNYAMHT